jgi:acetaldehyde dehydrogenase (acetylating)
MINVAILGTGNIGTDLLLKSLKSPELNVVAFTGRRMDSEGIQLAVKKKVTVSDQGIRFFESNPKCCDVVFDCTNAEDAKTHASIFRTQGIKVVDLTPAKVGVMCVPEINIDSIITENNINMITCGGQASLPVLNVLSNECKELDYVEVVTQISSKSAGMATRLNVDSYILTTQTAIKQFTNCEKCKVIINLNPAEPEVDMQTTIFVKAKHFDIENITNKILSKIQDIKKYIPYYELVLTPTITDHDLGVLMLSVRVRGAGDYLPSYAGNLDIINCAAIEVTKYYGRNHNRL